MSEKKRFSLSLYMSDPIQRETFELLQAVPQGQRTAYICRAVCWLHDQERLLDSVRAMLREALQTAPLQKAEPQPAESGSAEGNEPIDQNVLDFLRTLQNS